MMTGLSTEVVMTFFFLFVILGVTDKRGFAVFGGLVLTLIHLVSIPGYAPAMVFVDLRRPPAGEDSIIHQR